jgi:uncharacterized membrane protein
MTIGPHAAASGREASPRHRLAVMARSFQFKVAIVLTVLAAMVWIAMMTYGLAELIKAAMALHLIR